MPANVVLQHPTITPTEISVIILRFIAIFLTIYLSWRNWQRSRSHLDVLAVELMVMTVLWQKHFNSS